MTTTSHQAALDLGPNAVPTRPTECPRWRAALERRTTTDLAGRRSWDLYADLFSPTYDDLLDDADAGVAECIGLVCGFVEYVTGEALDSEARKLVAQGVRRHGKAMLYGLDQAIGTTEDNPRQWYRYALAVARRTCRDLRTEPRASWPS